MFNLHQESKNSKLDQGAKIGKSAKTGFRHL